MKENLSKIHQKTGADAQIFFCYGFYNYLIMSTRLKCGGERGIRTLDKRFSAYAPLAGECLRPLGHFSAMPSKNFRKSTNFGQI